MEGCLWQIDILQESFLVTVLVIQIFLPLLRQYVLSFGACRRINLYVKVRFSRIFKKEGSNRSFHKILPLFQNFPQKYPV